MAGIGDAIFKLLGQADPRQQLAAAVAGGGQPGGTPGAEGMGGAMPAAPPMPQEAGVYKSPQDLVGLYTSIIERDRKNSMIDRGIGLIGASLAFPENRPGIMAAFNRDMGGGDPADLIGNVMKLQASTAATNTKAAQRASIPAIASQYGLDVTTAMYLFDTGKLDSVIAELEKPERQLATDANTGQSYIIDLKNGSTVGEPFGTPKTREIEIIDGPDGSKIPVYKDDKTPVKGRGPTVPPGEPNTADQKDYEAYRVDQESRKLPVKSFEEWRLTKPPATKIDINNSEEDAGVKKFKEKSAENFADDYQKLRDQANAATGMMQQYDIAEKALASGVRTGFGGEAELAFRKLLQATGLSEQDANAIAGGELVAAVGNRMSALMRNPESGMGMPGSVSDRDLQFLKQANVGLGNSPEGNAKMIELFRRTEQRKIEVAKLANAYVKKNKVLDAGFDDELRAYAEANPLFDDLQMGPVNVEDLVKKYGK